MELQKIIDKAKTAPRRLSPRELEYLLSLESEAEQQRLFDAAYQVKLAYIGRKVSLRGLIEMGNICAKDCLYCGIRRGNGAVHRFELDLDAVERMARWAYEHNYGSLVLQAGEVESEKRTELVEEALRRIMKLSNGELGVTLSLGEQRDEVYRRWHAAGARRYLLRIETSSPDFYRKLHPAGHSFFPPPPLSVRAAKTRLSGRLRRDDRDARTDNRPTCPRPPLFRPRRPRHDRHGPLSAPPRNPAWPGYRVDPRSTDADSCCSASKPWPPADFICTT